MASTTQVQRRPMPAFQQRRVHAPEPRAPSRRGSAPPHRGWARAARSRPPARPTTRRGSGWCRPDHEQATRAEVRSRSPNACAAPRRCRCRGRRRDQRPSASTVPGMAAPSSPPHHARAAQERARRRAPAPGRKRGGRSRRRRRRAAGRSPEARGKSVGSCASPCTRRTAKGATKPRTPAGRRLPPRRAPPSPRSEKRNGAVAPRGVVNCPGRGPSPANSTARTAAPPARSAPRRPGSSAVAK